MTSSPVLCSSTRFARLRSTWTLRPTQRTLVMAALAVAAVLSGCSQNLLGFLQETESLGYNRTCTQLRDEHNGDVTAGRYFIPEFDVVRWPGTAPARATEPSLVDSIVAGKSRFVLVEARGGLGKTRMAKAIHAQTCGKLPVFTVDLNKDVAGAGDTKGGNPIIRVMARQLGIADDVEGQQRLDELLRSHSWVLLADAIEEVELNARPRVSIALAKLRQAYPQTAQVVVMARPPVLVPFYGFDDVDTVVRIHLVTCERADKVISGLSKSAEDKTNFATFLTRYGLDLKRTLDGRCVYPFMATYRDIHTLRKLGSEVGSSGVDTYADAHQALVALRLAKELDRMNWGQREVLDMVDRMVRFQRETQGTGDATFDVVSCMKSIDPEYGWTAVDAGVTGNDPQRRRQVCEKALQSVVFEKLGDGYAEEGRWAFFDPRTTALFRARWLNNELARGAAGDCKPLLAHTDMLADAETARFLAGQPLVQRCLGPVLNALCSPDAPKAKVLEALIEGMPSEGRRFQMVEEGRAWAAENGKPACVTASLDIVAKSIGR